MPKTFHLEFGPGATEVHRCKIRHDSCTGQATEICMIAGMLPMYACTSCGLKIEMADKAHEIEAREVTSQLNQEHLG